VGESQSRLHIEKWEFRDSRMTTKTRICYLFIGEVFKVKKSSHSKRIAKQLKMQSKLAREEEEKHQKKEDTPPRKASPVPREEPYEERDEEIRVK
jgi:hypothetical protein